MINQRPMVQWSYKNAYSKVILASFKLFIIFKKSDLLRVQIRCREPAACESCDASKVLHCGNELMGLQLSVIEKFFIVTNFPFSLSQIKQK